MQQKYTLLFTDAASKSSVINYQAQKLTIQERMSEQIDTLRSTLQTDSTKVEVSLGIDSATVFLVTVSRGYIYNSYSRTLYGTFHVVPLVDKVEERPVVSEQPETKKSVNPHDDVLVELRKKIEARRNKKIPYAPIPPPVYRIPVVITDNQELVQRLNERRRQLEGLSH